MSAKYPVQLLLDDIWNHGHTPRLLVDSNRLGVVMPAWVRAKWGTRLSIVLDASYPMNLEFNDIGIHADLAFQGEVMRCTMPWHSIYAVVDGDTGEGYLMFENLPDEDKRDVSEVLGTSTNTSGPVDMHVLDEPKADMAVIDEAAVAQELENVVLPRHGFRVIKGGKA